MDEFRKITQSAPTSSQKVLLRGKRGSYYYADVYATSSTGKPELTHAIRTLDTTKEVFQQNKKGGPVQMEFQQLPTGIRDPMEGSNYIDNPPPLAPRPY